MGTLGELLRWLGLNLTAAGRRIARSYRRLVAWLLRRDKLVARSERKFRALLEAAPDAMVIVDWHGHVQLVNAQAERIFGWDREDLIGQNVGELIPEPFRSRHRDHLTRYLRDAHPRGMGTGLELFGRRRDGSEFPVEISLGPLQTDQGMLVSAAIRDISERRRAETALREAEEQFRTAFEEAPVGMALVALDGRLLQTNRALCDIVGRSRAELEASSVAALIHPRDARETEQEMARLLAGEGERYRAEQRLIHASGQLVPVDLSVAVVHDGAGAARHLLAQVNDMTERKRFEGQLQYLADHDPLTGTFNRRRFEEELERELARVARYDGGGAVLAIDLDHFKYVNDTLGHTAGDKLIALVGRLFGERLRSTDTIARLGGDEFAVILPGVTRGDAVAVAEGLLAALHDQGRVGPAGGDGHPRRVTASIGVALLQAGGTSGEEKLVQADIAMYDAKEAGRDCVRVYDVNQDRQARMQVRLAWADRIKDALEDERFVLHAQPIASLCEDTVPRHELLIRMLGDRGDDLIPPGTFLYVAERFDLVQRIDRWVIAQAIALLAREKRRRRRLVLEVNLSAKSITDPALPDFVASELANAGIDGTGLCVEVTETAAIVNVDRARHFAHRLADLGCEFALDDFGAGFASFYYLKHMVFDYVKIDGEFIRTLPGSHVNQLVVRSVVDIAGGLGKRTIAEFVSDEETLELLRDYGVDYAQGFHVAHPQPLAALDLSRSAALPAR